MQSNNGSVLIRTFLCCCRKLRLLPSKCHYADTLQQDNLVVAMVLRVLHSVVMHLCVDEDPSSKDSPFEDIEDEIRVTTATTYQSLTYP